MNIIYQDGVCYITTSEFKVSIDHLDGSYSILRVIDNWQKQIDSDEMSDFSKKLRGITLNMKLWNSQTLSEVEFNNLWNRFINLLIFI